MPFERVCEFKGRHNFSRISYCFVILLDHVFIFLYSVILTEYVAMELRVCVCVCVCGSAAAQMDWCILMKLSTNDLKDICEVIFSQILKIRNR